MLCLVLKNHGVVGGKVTLRITKSVEVAFAPYGTVLHRHACGVETRVRVLVRYLDLSNGRSHSTGSAWVVTNKQLSNK